jgi:hypothetical protein
MRTVVGTAAAECVRVHTVTAVNSWACWLAGLQFAGRLTLHRSRPGRASAPGGGEGVLYMANARRTRRPKPVISGSGCEPVASPPLFSPNLHLVHFCLDGVQVYNVDALKAATKYFPTARRPFAARAEQVLPTTTSLAAPHLGVFRVIWSTRAQGGRKREPKVLKIGR